MNCRNFASIVVTLCTSAACGGPSQTAQPTVSPVASAPVAPASTVGESARGVDPPAASVSTTAGAPAATGAQPLTLDPQANPNLEFRIDAFSVPAASRAEFVAAMHANAAFLEKLPGFKGHTVLEKTSGPTTFNIVTIAAWESPEAMKNAGAKVREHYQAIGFDMQGSIARWGVTASIGSYHAPAALQ